MVQQQATLRLGCWGGSIPPLATFRGTTALFRIVENGVVVPYLYSGDIDMVFSVKLKTPHEIHYHQCPCCYRQVSCQLDCTILWDYSTDSKLIGGHAVCEQCENTFQICYSCNGVGSVPLTDAVDPSANIKTTLLDGTVHSACSHCDGTGATLHGHWVDSDEYIEVSK